MNNPFDSRYIEECESAYIELVSRIDMLRESDPVLFREFDEGKMLGVLIAQDREGIRHHLYAFSGQVGSHGFSLNGFVGPVFDYLAPDGYFKSKEKEISDINRTIIGFEKGKLADLKAIYEHRKSHIERLLSIEKEKYRISKSERDRKRKAGVSKEDELEMIRRSQFEKAEFRRLKKRLESELQPYELNMKEASDQLEAMKEWRHSESEKLQKWLFDNFIVLNYRGEKKSLSEIFADTSLKIPPSGAGECCAPKLLQGAYLRGWKPVAIAEYWYGQPKEGEVRIHGHQYPACRGKCLPILKWMLQGLEIKPSLDGQPEERFIPEPEVIFENEWFCVINKPSGMLSVEGKSRYPSVERWLINRFGAEREARPVHRLDQDTSGLILVSFGTESFKILQSLFATRRISKSYVAVLEGDFIDKNLLRTGTLALPLSPDYLDRPRQRVDLSGGKEALTEYEFVERSEGRSRVIFYPKTGRTHQLRIHAASPFGLGMPIVGDRLYNRSQLTSGERLHLHARELSFTFPLDGKTYSFEAPVPF